MNIKYDATANLLHLGFTPPKAVVMESPTAGILSLISILKEPKTILELKDHLLKQGTPPNETEDLLSDLQEIGLLTTTIDRTDRYSRHQLYFRHFDVPEAALRDLRSKSVLLIGAGGIGSTCAMLLCAAGVNKLILADPDRVETSNLPRSVLFTEADVGSYKVDAAAAQILARNASCEVRSLPVMLNDDFLDIYRSAVQNSDFVLLSGDSGIQVHELVHQLCQEFQKPYLNAGYVETYGVIGPFLFHALRPFSRQFDRLHDRT